MIEKKKRCHNFASLHLLGHPSEVKSGLMKMNKDKQGRQGREAPTFWMSFVFYLQLLFVKVM